MFKHLAWLIQWAWVEPETWGSPQCSQVLLPVRGQCPMSHCLEESKAASMMGNPWPVFFHFQTYFLSLGKG